LISAGAARKETTVLKRERALRLFVGVIALCATTAFIGWQVSRAAANEEQPVGRYQMAVPDLVLDTATGRLTTGNGQVLEQPIDPSGAEIGRYCVDGLVTSVTRYVGLDVINQPVARVDLVKAYVIGDTKTGRVVRQRTYYSQPIQPGDL